MPGTLKRAETKKQVVSEFRQSEIITAAREVFAERGYTGTTVDEIAVRAGLAKGTIYVYFESKEQVYDAVLESDRKALLDLTLQRMKAAEPALEKISAFIHTRFEFCEERRDFFRIMYTEPIHGPGPAFCKNKRAEWVREPVKQLASALEHEMSAKKINEWHPETVAWTIADLTSSALQRRLATTPTTTARQDADFLIDFVYAALRRC